MAPKKRAASRAYRHCEAHRTLRAPESTKWFLPPTQHPEEVSETKGLVATGTPFMVYLTQAERDEQESLNMIHLLEENLGQVGFVGCAFVYS